jgi:colicin import membrane protein
MMWRTQFSAALGLLGVMAMPVLAQTEQLQARRAAIEQTYQQDMAVCYQRFDVVSCRNEAREKRIQTSAALRKDELAHNARERQLAAQEAQRRSDEKLRESEEKAIDATAREAQPQNSTRLPQSQQSRDNSERAAYEQKQREAAERRSSIEKRLRERDKPPAAPLPLPEAAK